MKWSCHSSFCHEIWWRLKAALKQRIPRLGESKLKSRRGRGRMKGYRWIEAEKNRLQSSYESLNWLIDSSSSNGKSSLMFDPRSPTAALLKAARGKDNVQFFHPINFTLSNCQRRRRRSGSKTDNRSRSVVVASSSLRGFRMWLSLLLSE